jgi:hypothetical protein
MRTESNNSRNSKRRTASIRIRTSSMLPCPFLNSLFLSNSLRKDKCFENRKFLSLGEFCLFEESVLILSFMMSKLMEAQFKPLLTQCKEILVVSKAERR